MSPEAQRIAIAEACGWSKDGWPPGRWYPAGKRTMHFPVLIEQDLNAMHEAEKVLTPDQRGQYITCLALACGNIGEILFATATQRAEAFLRTLNLWDDSR